MDVNQLERSPALSSNSTERLPAIATPVDRWSLTQIKRGLSSAPIRLVLWDGFALSPAGPPVASLTFQSRGALFGCAWDPQLYFGEGYMSGALQVHGDLLALLEAIYRALGPRTRRSWWPWQRANGTLKAKANVHHHYDLGNDFYRRWLDREMVYTCAYFPAPDATLEEAQIAKMDLVCRKLRLAPGEHVIEAGCGWGSLALFMARRYGVTVQAFNLSSEQIAYARRRAAEEGMADRVEFVEDDYRSVRGTCDAFVSVGMLEHVGVENYPALGAVIDRSLDPEHGRGLLHFIGRDQPRPFNNWIRRRIFPGAYPPALGEAISGVLEPARVSVVHVENLRNDYARTLAHWRERFERSAEVVTERYGGEFTRAWRLYLAGSEAAFRGGSLQLFQVLFARAGSEHLGRHEESTAPPAAQRPAS